VVKNIEIVAAFVNSKFVLHKQWGEWE